MTCQTCKHCQKKMTFLGFRLRCTRFKRSVQAGDHCIDWGAK